MSARLRNAAADTPDLMQEVYLRLLRIDDLAGFQYAPGIPLTLDESGTWFKSFRVSSPPTLFLVNRDGKIVRRVDGFDPTLPDVLKTAWSH